mgnify:CR=1 FL=1
MDAESTLLGSVDEEESAQRPERLPTEVVAVLLVDDDHPTTRLGEFVGRDESGKAGPDNDGVGLSCIHVRCVHESLPRYVLLVGSTLSPGPLVR